MSILNRIAHPGERDAESAVLDQRRSELHYVRSMAVRFDGPNYPHVVSKLGENLSKKGFADKSSPGLRVRWSVEEGITV
jgi:hypothetical protein